MVTDTDSTMTDSLESGDLSTTAEKVRLPHDQSGMLWFEDQPTALFLESIDRWTRTLLEDDGFVPVGASKPRKIRGLNPRELRKPRKIRGFATSGAPQSVGKRRVVVPQGFVM